jgi:TetR/AcrR family transcriptional regulator
MKIKMNDKIIAKATQLFSQFGYDSLGINEIVEQCGVTKPTLYYYFGSKENLLKTIITRHGEKLRVNLLGVYTIDAPFEIKLALVADAYVRYASEHKDFLRLFLSLIFTPHSNKAYQITKVEAEQIQSAIEMVFQNEDGFEVQKAFFAASFIGQLNIFATLILNGYIEYSEGLSETIAKIFLNGARSIIK